MEIQFETTIDDLIAFNKYHYANSSTFQKQKKRDTIILPIIIFVLLITLYALIQSWEILLFGLIFLSLYIFFILRAYKSGIYKNVKKIIEEQDTKGTIGKHILKINEDGLTEITEVNERKDKWSGVQKIVVDNDHAFIYVGTLQAHVIPKGRIIEGNFDEFIERAESYWGNTQFKDVKFE